MVQVHKALQAISLLLVAFLAVAFFSSLFTRRSPVEEEASTPKIVGADADSCFPEEDDVSYKIDDSDAIDSSNVKPPPVPDPYTINVTIPNVLMSTCSDEATSRGPHQKVIAFIFYGKINCSRNYFEGIEENLLLAEKMYPGWIVRVYYELYKPVEHAAQLLADLKARYRNLDLCNCNNIPGYGDLEGSERRIWRFLPLVDPLVDIFISRDLDGRFSERELAAVHEWLESGLTFHVMRDSLFQGYAILAGMWGVRVHQARELLFSLMMQIFIRGRVGQRSTFDQSVLQMILWPVIKGHVMQHDSYYCEGKFAEHGNMRPFPTRRIENELNNYVGSNVVNSVVMDYPCPVACRPPEHTDWTTC
ncbi:uncharacterized protein [Anabrus simplex]|uniref:uncharacterized protein n=1 Tax=Anabrus simplex TaxID=316456 RepID=UPI0035A344D8